MAVESPLVPVINHLRAGAYTCAAGGTVLLYDILLTTKDEIRLIWPSRLSLVKCLYFVNRYLPVPCLILGMYHLANYRDPLSTDFCKLVTLSQTIGQAISLVTATWLLVLRVIALYGGNKWVAIGLYTVFISTHLATVIMSIVILQDMWGGLSYIAFIGICAAKGAPVRTLGVVYFTPVLCESVLVTMQLIHAYRHTRQLQTLMRPTTPLLRTLYADGFAYFVVVVTLRLWSAFIFMFADVSYWYISTYMEFALISTSVSRLVLHLRGTAEVHRSHHLNLSITIPLSQPSHNPDRKSSRNQSRNRNDRHGRARVDHVTSSFENPSHTIYEYPLEIPQVHFSSTEHRRPATYASQRETMQSSAAHHPIRGSTLVVPHTGAGHTQTAAEEGHRCDLYRNDIGDLARNDDHSYVGFFQVYSVGIDDGGAAVEAGGS